MQISNNTIYYDDYESLLPRTYIASSVIQMGLIEASVSEGVLVLPAELMTMYNVDGNFAGWNELPGKSPEMKPTLRAGSFLSGEDL